MASHTSPSLTLAVSRRRFLVGAVILAVTTGCASRAGSRVVGPETMPSGPVDDAPSDSVSETTAYKPDGPTSVTAVTSTELFEISRTDEQWRQLLTSQQYDVLRSAGTEAPFSSPLNDQHGTGDFTCAGCNLDLFASSTKFDSGTGWPSFWQVNDDAVLEEKDSSVGMVRIEVLCRRCGGHLGHVFDDGPPPTGLRYCMNGVALGFRPSA